MKINKEIIKNILLNVLCFVIIYESMYFIFEYAKTLPNDMNLINYIQLPFSILIGLLIVVFKLYLEFKPKKNLDDWEEKLNEMH